MRTTIAIAALLMPALVGCGGSSTSDDSPAGGGSAGTGATGGSGGSSGGGGTAGTGGASGGSGGTAACSGFEDEVPPPQTWTLRLKNARSTPIYVGGGNDCGPKPLYELEGPDGPVQFYASNCESTCADLQQHGPYCTGACMIPPVIKIDPGGHCDAPWSGTTFEALSMPGECYKDGSTGGTCDRRIIAPEGSYAAQAVAATALSCDDLGTCSCTPDASGSCQIQYGGTPSGETITGKGTLKFPSESVAELVFQ